MSVYYEDEHVTLYHGDAVEQMRTLADGSVACVVTSPPYYGLRDYGTDGQYGLEASPGEYVEAMQRVFTEARRVLADDGTLWLNLGDSYSTQPGWGRGGSSQLQGRAHAQAQDDVHHVRHLPSKNLLGIPWRVAIALQDDGWTLRNAIVWHKPNAMPESVRDRFSTRHEHVFLFAKSPRYWFDLDAVREDRTHERPPIEKNRHAVDRGDARYGGNARSMHATGEYRTSGKNPGDVWSLSTQPFPGAHFACMPPKLAERCVLAGCRPGGVVLDPFSGSGTTGAAAARLGRRYVGIDLNADYLGLSLRTRLAQSALIAAVEVAP